MSEFLASRKFVNTSDFLLVETPDNGQFDVIIRVSGTFVGTLKAERTADLKTFAALTLRDVNAGTTGNPTAPATVQSRLTAADKGVKVSLSAYTSGTVVAEVLLIRVPA